MAVRFSSETNGFGTVKELCAERICEAAKNVDRGDKLEMLRVMKSLTYRSWLPSSYLLRLPDSLPPHVLRQAARKALEFLQCGSQLHTLRRANRVEWKVVSTMFEIMSELAMETLKNIRRRSPLSSAARREWPAWRRRSVRSAWRTTRQGREPQPRWTQTQCQPKCT